MCCYKGLLCPRNDYFNIGERECDTGMDATVFRIGQTAAVHIFGGEHFAALKPRMTPAALATAAMIGRGNAELNNSLELCKEVFNTHFSEGQRYR